MESTSQREGVLQHYLELVRDGIPFGVEHAKIMLQVVHFFACKPKRIMDLGCGNGFLSEILLKTYPEATAVLIDHSQLMVEHARLHMKEYKNRCEIILGDFSHDIGQYAELGSVDCIISGYAIHHLSQTKKEELYQEIYKVLATGGIFLNVEQAASLTPTIGKSDDEFFINHNKNNQQKVAKEYDNPIDKKDHLLQKVNIQVNWLREIGFKYSDCYFKWMEVAIFGGIK